MQEPSLFKKYLFYLAVLGLGCGTWDLPSSCGMQFFGCGVCTLSCSVWDLVPQPGFEPWHPLLEVWSLIHWTTKEVLTFFFFFFFNLHVSSLLASLMDPFCSCKANQLFQPSSLFGCRQECIWVYLLLLKESGLKLRFYLFQFWVPKKGKLTDPDWVRHSTITQLMDM